MNISALFAVALTIAAVVAILFPPWPPDGPDASPA